MSKNLKSMTLPELGAVLKEMGVEYVDETYVVNYKYNVVIPLSTTENIHAEIDYYNGLAQ